MNIIIVATADLLAVTPFIPVGGQWEQIPFSLYSEHFPQLHPIHPRKYTLSKDKILKSTAVYYCHFKSSFCVRVLKGMALIYMHSNKINKVILMSEFIQHLC